MPAAIAVVDTNVDVILVNLATVDTNVDQILVDTGTTLPAAIAAMDTVADQILVDTGTTLPAAIAAMDTVADQILVDTGTTLPGLIGTDDGTTTESLHGKLGTDTELADRSMFDVLAGDGPAVFPAGAAPTNDVSLAEVIRYIVENQLPRTVAKNIDLSADHGLSASPVTEFTVTGNVMCRAIGCVATSVASTGDDGEIALGVSDDTDVLIPKAIANGTSLVAGDVWFDTTSGTKAGGWPDDGSWVVIAEGADIIMTIATATIGAGNINVYVQWIPLSSGASIVSA